MRYGVLGPLEVTFEGLPVELGGHKQRALLAILLLERNAVVPVDRIIDRLWDGTPPASAATTLQGYLSHLRKALHNNGDAPRLVTQPPGYLLRVGPGEVDAEIFTELARAGAAALAAGDAHRAGELLDQALALWRGQPLSDFAGATFAREEQARLEEIHQQAVEDRLDAAMALGRHHTVIAELQAHVNRHPLRERLRGQLMLALYRSGRQVEALEVYRRGREELAEELGIDPGPELQQLEAAILRQDPGLGHVAAPAAGHAATPGAAAAVTPPAAAADTATPDPAPAATPDPAPAATPDPAPALPLTPRTNLTEPSTPIIGRQSELADLTGLLATARLVTITGPGGTGKTRLATEVARRWQAPAPDGHRAPAPDGHKAPHPDAHQSPDRDGPWIVELACLSEPALVPNAVAQALGLVVTGECGVVDLVGRALGDRATLVLLDNCEHLIGPVAELAEALLGRCPNLQILATSRELLSIQPETAYPLAPLPVADRTPEARMVDGDAMRLFAARAAAVIPGFTITAENRSVIRQICRELDGLPLAIELAAARLRLLAPEQVAEHLGDRFTLLAGGSRTAQPRQRAMRAAVDWSYDLLDADEQRLFTALSTFRGGFELDAVAALWDGPSSEALDLLDALVAKSLVTVDTTVTPRRYGLLATLREYGHQRLSAADINRLGARHAAWCTALTVEGEDGLRGPDWLRWLTRLDAEHDNFRAAVGYALDAGDATLAASITGPLGWYWFRRGRIDEARQWLERCAELRDGAASPAWSRVLLSLGTVRYLSGDPVSARPLGDEAIAMARKVGAGRELVQALLYSAYFETPFDVAEAKRRVEEGLALVRDLGIGWLEAEALTALGELGRAIGDLEQAEVFALQGAQAARAAGYWWQELGSRWTAARILLDRGDAGAALENLRGVVQGLVTAGDGSGALLALHILASAASRTRDPHTGPLLLGAVAVNAERVGFFPERVDPAETQRILDDMHERIPQAEFAAAFQRGRELPREDLEALVNELAGV